MTKKKAVSKIDVEKKIYSKFCELVDKHKESGRTFEVEKALQYFINIDTLPSEIQTNDVLNKIAGIEIKLDSLINRNFGFLKMHEKLMFEKVEELKEEKSKRFRFIEKLIYNIYSYQSLNYLLNIDLLKLSVEDKNSFLELEQKHKIPYLTLIKRIQELIG